MKMYK